MIPQGYLVHNSCRSGVTPFPGESKKYRRRLAHGCVHGIGKIASLLLIRWNTIGVSAYRHHGRDARDAYDTFSDRLLPGQVLRIADFLQPVDRAAVQLFLNGDMRHRGGG